MNIKNISKIFSADFWSDDDVKKPQKAEVLVVKNDKYVMLTTSQILRIWLINKLSKKDGTSFKDVLAEVEVRNHEKHRKPDIADNPTPESIEVYFIAIMLDGEVVDILRASQNVADYLLAGPSFELFSPSVDNVAVGSKLVNGEWVHKEAHSHD